MTKPFNTVDWARGSNIYEVNIRQYTPEGTFEAFSKHLPRLKDMGIEILWLMPITPISIEKRLGTLGSYYSCSSYVGINPEFGKMSNFMDLVEEAHRLGFKLIIDWVANHTGWDHEWTKSNPEFYLQDESGRFTEKNGWEDVIDLDYGKKEMREAMITSMRFWVKEFDIDGFRCDMAHLVPLDFWEQARTACEAIKPLFWLAECEEPSYHHVYDVSYAWQWLHITEKLVKGQAGVNDLYNVLHEYSQYPFNALKLYFTSNHDENSWNGTEYERYGNAAIPLAVFSATWASGVPLIYSGQELPNKKRLNFFTDDAIEWKFPTELHGFYKALLGVNKTNAVARGETFNLPSSDCVMAFLRKYKDEVVLVILNLSGTNKIRFTVENDAIKGLFTNVFSGLEYEFNTKETFELMAFDYIVYRKF
jgi:glycosidase